MDNHDMTFSWEQRRGIRDARAWWAVRPESEWNHVREGHGLVLLTEDGEQFGTATVVRVGVVEAAYFYEFNPARHRSYDNLQHFLEVLSEHYPDGVRAKPHSPVVVIRFDPEIDGVDGQ